MLDVKGSSMARIRITPKAAALRVQEILDREKPRARRTVDMLSDADRQRYFERAIKELEAEGTTR